MKRISSATGYSRPELMALAIAVAAALGSVHSAQAVELGSSPDWNVQWNNTLQYNLGIRARNPNGDIANNPIHAESEYKFDERGDVVTNRFALFSEIDAVYQGQMGVRVSASAWKDFAYDDDAETKPGYPSNYQNREYSNYTKKYYMQGAQLLDAFAFTKFQLFDRPSTLRLGRLTQYWGNSMFFSSLGASYSQSATDLIKAAAAPGTLAKELALPRGQINFSTQLTDELSIGMQYFLEYEPDRLPQGGTFLAPVDFLFQGPDQFAALGGLVQRNSHEPKNINDNFGVNLRWSPSFTSSTFGMYYRQFDEARAWAPFIYLNNGVPDSYSLAYAEGVKLFGLSVDQEIGGYSVGAEINYRHGTALKASNTVSSPDDIKGPRGNTLNILVNAQKGLERTDFYDTGIAMFELGYVRKLKVTEHEERYKGVGTQACNSSVAGSSLSKGGRRTGCATDETFLIAGLIEPQWLQVFSGVDLSMPVSVMYGISGFAASESVPVGEGDVNYSIGVRANIRQRYNVALQYNGAYGPSSGTSISPFDGSTYDTAGNNLYMSKDRQWWSLSASTTF